MASELPGGLQRFINGILPENPVYRQVLAMCPTLAVTNTIAGAVTMAGATAFVLICANVVTAALRRLLQPHLRILVFTVTISAFVTIADRMLAAFMPAMSQKLGPYVPLIIVNCMIICRCEVCASKQGVAVAAADALGQSLGFLAALLSISIVREILAFGSIFQGWAGANGEGLRVLPKSFPNWNLMALPPGAFFTLGILLGLANWCVAAREKRKTAS
ncbi:MAG: electron transport complex subunit RsxE [Planctomycetes bacterium]|nr:electron transport complex subunit RsxE [Planctomycetota bacterium]